MEAWLSETQQHTYNLEDFLHSSVERDSAKEEFPSIYFSLFSSYISDEVLRLDAIANKKKVRLQNFGMLAVFLALIALALAAIDIALLAPILNKTEIQKNLAIIIPFVAALSGISSFIIGYYGAGIGSRKRDWIRLRMQTELIRQWKARYYLNHRNQILTCVGDARKAADYSRSLRRDFQDFSEYLNLHSDLLLEEIVNSSSTTELAEVLQSYMGRVSIDDPAQSLRSEEVDEFYRAYRRMRLQGQENYAGYIATSSGPFRTHPRVQKENLHTVGIYSVFGIVILHVSVTLGVLTGIKELKSIYVHLTTVILALVALAARAFEDGLKPNEHLTRYAGYFATVKHLALHFDRARKPSSKHEYGWELEEAAYAEMVEFLKTCSKARFLM